MYSIDILALLTVVGSVGEGEVVYYKNKYKKGVIYFLM